MDNVPAIVPLLEREHRVAESRLAASKKELDDLATDKLKVRVIWVELAGGLCQLFFHTRPLGASEFVRVVPSLGVHCCTLFHSRAANMLLYCAG